MQKVGTFFLGEGNAREKRFDVTANTAYRCAQFVCYAVGHFVFEPAVLFGFGNVGQHNFETSVGEALHANFKVSVFFLYLVFDERFLLLRHETLYGREFRCFQDAGINDKRGLVQHTVQ